NVAKDLELFAHHAGRKIVNMDDVVLSGINRFMICGLLLILNFIYGCSAQKR
ncbi:hypothetical protein AALP_AA8G284100, partial [Arabis alpina]